MVGTEGDRRKSLGITRVEATNRTLDHIGMVRIVDLWPRQDGEPWKIGDRIGLVGRCWLEPEIDTEITSTITRILDIDPD